MDFLIILIILDKFNINTFYYVTKNSIKYIPGIGTMIYYSNDIIINRKWKNDKHLLKNYLDNICNDSNSDNKIIIIFPEGTRYTERKFIESNEYSINNNLPIYNNLLVPKMKGLWYILNYLYNNNQLGNIIDLSIIFPNENKNILFNFIQNNTSQIYFLIRNINFIHYTEYNKFKNWFLNEWKIKDNNITNYKQIKYNKVNTNLNIINIIIIIIILLLSIILLKNSYTRKYLLFNLIIYYIFIIHKFL